ncbi:SGT1 protein-domain-containing protein [Chaetomium fimeti]|uniref:SGT1 protein-domain-containing protein n=1 Tax=Chaetomium fimeti TaxID=1854472 RepID=A0AAE0HRS3_9PEZI|nr:SGT1 protein-domain-containing protein [Chaetomium fimeti]
MDTAAEPRPGDEDFDGFRMRVSEDYAEYMLFVIGDKTDSSLPSLEVVRKAADRKLDELAKDYIWQREPFKLEAKTQKGLGLPYLHGITHYGDNVEDEWLIVYLLRELSKAFSQLWIRVSDSDGEFLLIEAAKVTPKWLSPENDANRVWIHDGKLLIIPLTDSTTTATSKPLSLPEAIKTIKTSPPPTLIHSPLVEAESFYRLEKYPAQITTALHHSLVTIPRKLAHILHARPKAVAPATEAFYLRDPRALKPLLSPPSLSPSTKQQEGGSSSLLTFPPTDLVTVSVRFTKVLYAQLRSQHFAPPPAWGPAMRAAEAKASAASAADAEAAPEAAKALARLEMGVKLTTGFELLARTAGQSASRVVREVALLLEDLVEDGGDSALPTDGEIARWEGAGREDDDGWMDIDFGDFERELEGKKTNTGESGFGDAAAQADLRKIVSRFEAFLNDESAGIEGAETEEMDRDDDSDEEEGSDDDEDREVSFDEEQFGRMMREMMGLPAEDDGREKGKAKAVEEELDEEDEEEESEDEEVRKLTEQMESELKKFGALELDPKPKTTATIKEKGEGSSKKKEEAEAESSDEAIDIDYNLAKNLLESFKSQAGMAGPAGNILGMMGMTLPRDEDDSGDE